MSTQTLPRPTRSIGQSAVPVKRLSLSDIKTGGSGLPNRYAFHAVQGFGKTSLGAYFPKPIFIQSRGETGLETLIDSGVLPETPHLPVCNSWREIHDAIDFLIEEDHPHKTLVFDTINGGERLCHELVCERDFGGEWGEKGFGSYQKGPEVALPEWLLMLGKLDRLREQKKMTILLLAHTKVQTFKNPLGTDYDRYQADLNKWTWGATDRWADVVLFGNYEIIVDAKRNAVKGKATSQRRVVYTQRTAAYDAKNRLGLPPEIDMGDSAEEAWENFSGAVKEARSHKTQPASNEANQTTENTGGKQ